MRPRLARRAQSSLVAEEALQRAIGEGGGIPSPPPPLPSATEIVYVNKGGNNTTGTGTIIQPFLTPTKALASITDASAAKPYTVQMGPGIYPDPLALKSFVSFVGEDPNDVAFSGTFSLDPGFVNNGYTGFTNIHITANQNLNFAAIVNGQVSFYQSETSKWQQEGTSGSQFFAVASSFGSTQFTDVSLVTQASKFPAVIWVAQNVNVTWSSNSDAFPSTVEEEASGAFTATFTGISSQVAGPLNLFGANTVFQGTAGFVPPTVIRGGGAPPPVLLSFGNGIGYAPTTAAANWGGVAPGAVSDPNVAPNSALDRLATAVAGLLGTPIP
jgi:hypothetical protein